MKRRQFLQSALSVTAGAMLFGASRGATRAPPPELVVTELASGLFMIAGAGGNVTVWNSAEGVLLVDGGSPQRSADVLRLVKNRTGRSAVHTLFNTHWHWDQTGSNRVLGEAGTRIVSHENTRLWLGTTIHSQWQNRDFPPLPKAALPTRTFYSQDSLSFGGEQIDYGYLPQAHTDGDLYVYFRKANVLVAADVVAVGSYPILDYSTNGWIGGMANATQTLIDLSDSQTRIVPGIGQPQSRAYLQAEHAMLADLKERLAKLLAQGMSVKDMQAAAPTREYDAQWGDPGLFIANAWPGLVERARELGVSIV